MSCHVSLSQESSKWITLKKSEDGVVSLESGASVNLYRDMLLMTNSRFNLISKLRSHAQRQYLFQFIKMYTHYSESVILGDRKTYMSTIHDQSATTIAQLNSESVDISLNQETITKSRAEASTFLQPTYYGSYLNEQY